MNPHASAALPLTIKEIPNLRGVIAEWRSQGHNIAFVPTMGALHKGHLALIHAAKKHHQRVVVSIFVNPTQFGPNEDFSLYPRPLDADLEMLADVRADLVWLPDVEDIYPTDSITRVTVGELGKLLCGKARPIHFDGVATVVSMLLNAVRPDASFFGEKDYQQLSIIRAVARDLWLPGEIVCVPTQRAPDGLALSSRNRYLSDDQRQLAPMLYQALQNIAREGIDASALEASLHSAAEELTKAGFDLDYLEVRDERHFTPLDHPTLHARIFVAARLGKTRLIDNLPMRQPHE